ncbi:MAG: type VII secretion target [Pseudonocardia sp.]
MNADTGTGFAVDPDLLNAHAGQVEGFAQLVGAAADAAQPLGLDAYGRIGRLFASTATQTAQTCSAAVASLSRLAHDLDDRLRASAAEYRAVDDQVATELGRIG